MKAAKNLMNKGKKAGADSYLSLLSNKNTPTEGFDSSNEQKDKNPTSNYHKRP